MTLKKELTETQCQECGCSFQDTIYFRADGSPMGTYAKCPDCREKEAQLSKEQRLQKDLKETIDSQEGIWRDECNVPSGFALKTFANFDTKLQPVAFKTVKNLQWHWGEGDDEQPKSLVLLSPGIYGLGKTHLVCALINQIIETDDKALIIQKTYIRKRPCPVFYISENVLLRRIRQTYSRNSKKDFTENYEETEEDVYKKLAKYDLLIIDDVGKVRARDMSFLQGVYFNIIDQRYNDCQPIILTTNLDYTDLEVHIGGACADRLLEMAGKEGFIVMRGTSYRKKKMIDK